MANGDLTKKEIVNMEEVWAEEGSVIDSASAPALLPLSWLGAIFADKRSTVGPQKVDGMDRGVTITI